MTEEIKKYVPNYIRKKISTDEIILTFTKSGNTYSFTSENIIEQQSLAFENLKYLNSNEVGKLIKNKYDKITKDIQKKENIIPYKTQTKFYVVNDIDTDDIKELVSKYSKNIFENISNSWKNYLVSNPEDYNEYLENMFSNDIENTVYDQNLNKLDLSNIENVILVEECDKYGPQYFYTKNEFVNGYQLWYKALNPFLWYGINI